LSYISRETPTQKFYYLNYYKYMKEEPNNSLVATPSLHLPTSYTNMGFFFTQNIITPS